MKISIKFWPILWVLFWSLTVYNPEATISIPRLVYRVVFIAFSGYMLYKVYLNKNGDKFTNLVLWKLFIVPDMLIYVYSVLVTILQGNQMDIFERTNDMFLSRLLMVLVVWAFIMKYSYKAIDYFLYGCLLNYSVTVYRFFAENGLVNGLKMTSIGSYGLSIEVHNMSYIFGFFALYYWFIAPTITPTSKKVNAIKTILCLLCVYLGQKRLILLSAVVSILIWLLLCKVEKKQRNKIVKFVVILLIGMAFLYVWLINNGMFVDIFNYFGLKASSRVNFYTYFSGQYDFSVLFLGRGITYTDAVMGSFEGMENLGIKIVTTLHNDVLRMFIGIGFVPTLLYLYQILYKRVKVIVKNYGEQSTFQYFVVAVMYFINWFASNAGLEAWCYSGFVFVVMTTLYASKNQDIMPNKSTSLTADKV